MIYCGISLLVNTRRLEIILKYFNFIKSLERIFTFKPPLSASGLPPPSDSYSAKSRTSGQVKEGETSLLARLGGEEEKSQKSANNYTKAENLKLKNNI
jgi:hypothetical protein